MAAAAHTGASQFAVAMLQSEDIDSLLEGQFADQTSLEGPGLQPCPNTTYISVQLMIEIIFYVEIAFFYRKANILRRGCLIFYRILREQRPVSLLQISLIRMATFIASYGLSS